MEFSTPILFLTWKRIDITKKVFGKIKAIKPRKLYISSDGPRLNKSGEEEKISQVRDYLLDNIDWNCEVKTLFYNENKGCRNAVSKAISWFFDNENEGIILEDDCVPTEDFFYFCQSLLEKYRHDNRIWCISGDNFQDKFWRGDGSYYFSRYNHCWGWASWKRCWTFYEDNLESWPKLKSENYLDNIFDNNIQKRYWSDIWDGLYYENKPDSWAYRWTYTCMINNGLTALPNKNLVENIGFDEDSTHTHKRRNYRPNLNSSRKVDFLNLKHPSFILRNKAADHYTEINKFSRRNIYPIYLLKKFLKIFLKFIMFK